MATILTWRNDGGQPHCDMLLENGERVRIVLGTDGVAIDRLGLDRRPSETLFRGDADLAARICHGLLDGRSPAASSPLDILARTVAGLPTAAAVKHAFADAAAALQPPRFAGLLRRWFGAIGWR